MDGSIDYPYNEISTAFNNILYNYAIIYLLGGDFYFNPLGNNFLLSYTDYIQIIIQPYYCSQGNHFGCFLDWQRPKIILKNEAIAIIVNYQLIIKNIIFSHDYLFIKNCTGCNYCPYASKPVNGTIKGDRNNTLIPGQFLNQSYCNVFLSYALFEINNGGELIIEVRYYLEYTI